MRRSGSSPTVPRALSATAETQPATFVPWLSHSLYGSPFGLASVVKSWPPAQLRSGWSDWTPSSKIRTLTPLPPTSAEGRWLKGLGVDMVGSQIVDQSIVAARLGLGVLALVVLVGWAGLPRNQHAEL